MRILVLVLAAMATSAMAFDFNAFPGQYKLMKEGSLQGNCPSDISILENPSGFDGVPGSRSFHVYNLDLTDNEAWVDASIFLSEVGGGWITHNSAGEKSETTTFISERDPSELVWSIKGRFYIDEDNQIPAPMRSFSYSITIAQGDNLNIMALSQHKISGKRVAEELECLYERH